MHNQPKVLVKDGAQVHREKEAGDRIPTEGRGGGLEKKLSSKTKFVSGRKQSDTKDMTRDLSASSVALGQAICLKCLHGNLLTLDSPGTLVAGHF